MNQRLTALNGQAFANLQKIQKISLENIYCIQNGQFGGQDVREKAYEYISKKCGFDEFDSVEIACEGFEDYSGSEFCRLRQAAINPTNFVIADLRDEEVDEIRLDGNKRIEYLSYKIYMQFPNLDAYWAGECSIKQISKENFENLNKLIKIYLAHNQIQKISGNTFKGLGQLRVVDLSKFYICIILTI